MIVKIEHSQVAEDGSCAPQVEYMNHEDEQRMKAGLPLVPIITPDGEEVTMQEVITAIDNNGKGLNRGIDKAFHLIVSPSADEIRAMGDSNKEVYHNSLKFIRFISDAYAENFNREGLNDSSDLLIYWKAHFTRGQNGDLQFHLHAIVSRCTKGLSGKKQKISPLTNHRGTEIGPVTGGFDRTVFARSCEMIFDKLFQYDRKVEESFDYRNAMAHGTLAEKEEQATRAAKEKQEKTSEVKAPMQKQSIRMEDIMPSIAKANSPLALQLALASLGISYQEIKAASGGIDDIIFIHAGRKVSARSIMNESEHRTLLTHWQRITGQIPAFVMIENKAAKEAKKSAVALKVPQRKMGGHKIGR